ncbi:MAG: hypothetical protein FJ308_14690 [Planctomycetes bacterium]|nr:hypothetical protein [Planctomycetota bacterium]
MNIPGPSLDSLIHRLGECPPEFLELTMEESRGTEILIAILGDTFMEYGEHNPWQAEDPFHDQLRHKPTDASVRRHRGLLGVIAWLLFDEWFQQNASMASRAWPWMRGEEVLELSQLVRPELFTSDMDRREELVRVLLASMDVRPAGETIEQSRDRMATLDSVERSKVVQATKAAERRAREIRKAMAQKAALESASRYGE